MGPVLAQGGEHALEIAVFVFAAIVLLPLLVFAFTYGVVYMKARAAGVDVSILNIMRMRLCGLEPAPIIDDYVRAVKGGVPVDLRDLETHCLARGDVHKVVSALVAAQASGIPLSFRNACAIDLAGRDLLGAVGSALEPRVLNCPGPEGGDEAIVTAAGDGVEIEARARVTVRTCLERLVSGAKEPTLIQEITDAIMDVIEDAQSHETLLNDPDAIGRKVLGMGLDGRAAFEIDSIDVEVQKA